MNELNSQDIKEDHIDIDSDVCRETPSLKTGIKLPTNDKQWEMANEYFKPNVNCGEVSPADDINNCIENVMRLFIIILLRIMAKLTILPTTKTNKSIKTSQIIS